ncbi:hypothetical protein EON65_07690 [archaeon]|nr:MAG: hypothetical protein EON65_07690 [archaeon]
MGKSHSRDLVIPENEKRNIFIAFKSYRVEHSGVFGTFCVFTFVVRYRRFRWEFDVRYNELLSLEKKLAQEFPDAILNVPKLSRHNKIFWAHDAAFLQERAKIMTKYLQDILDIDGVTESVTMLQLIGASKVSFSPELGPKGKEGYLKKSSGGYKEKFSRKAGDFFQVWTWRWFVLQDNCITWYKTPKDSVPLGALQIDQDFVITAVKRVIRVSTATRNLILYAPTERQAIDWTNTLRSFYGSSPRLQKHPFESSFPPRAKCDVQVYSVTKDYYHAVALAMLGAQREILITDWKMSPSVLLTRPPLPPLRLDQLLKYKADQGVNIFVLLYKEVEHIGQGNDSGKVKQKLESLSPNIHVLRHPNKFFGGSTAMLWSHHEKIVVIDRNVAFLGGVDLAFQRWDDEKHRVTDEDGVM